jgi:5-methylcytosine-specific restriction endonuclease McrA
MNPRRQALKRLWDERRRKAQAWRGWYKREPWLSIRKAQLAAHPACEQCLRQGRLVDATVVDHVTPHRGDWNRFVSGPFESLCKDHHDAKTARETLGKAAPSGDVDPATGLPTDPNHPWYSEKSRASRE